MVEKAAGAEAPLEVTLQKSKRVAGEVQSASDNLAVVGTVLEHQLPEEAVTGEVAQAIEHTNELEKKLAHSAKQLAEVNAVLAREIDRQTVRR